jgi:hypothetical protein
MGLLHGLKNARGPLGAEAKARLREAVEHPTSASWEAAHQLVITKTGRTLWQGVCCVDPTFPTAAPPRGQPWPRVPDSFTIVRAIRAAANGRITLAQVQARLGMPRETV